MFDFDYNLHLEDKLSKFVKQYPVCDKQLIEIAQQMWSLSNNELQIEEKALLSLSPAIKEQIVLINNGIIQFASQIIYLYFTARHLAESYICQIWDNGQELHEEIRILHRKHIHFKYCDKIVEMLILVLHNEFNKDICKRISSLPIKNEDNYEFLSVYIPFCTVLPYLKLIIDNLLNALDIIDQISKNDVLGESINPALSVTSAKVLGITIFMSDESSLQNIIDRHLNSGGLNDIKVFRVKNVIEWIRDNQTCGINRKTAKAIWAASDKSRATSEESKRIFNEIWPEEKLNWFLQTLSAKFTWSHFL